MRLAERVAAEAGYQFPDLADLLRRVAAGAGGGEELARDLLDDRPLLLHQRAAQHIGAPGVKPANASQICRMCSS